MWQAAISEAAHPVTHPRAVHRRWLMIAGRAVEIFPFPFGGFRVTQRANDLQPFDRATFLALYLAAVCCGFLTHINKQINKFPFRHVFIHVDVILITYLID